MSQLEAPRQRSRKRTCFGSIPFWVLVLLSALGPQRAAAQEPSWEERQNIPRWAIGVLQGPEFNENYLLSSRLNPFLVQGDFNGDGVLDIAVLITRRTSGAQGIAILHAGAGKSLVIGAGHAIGNGGDDFSWMGAWSVYTKGPVFQGVYEGKPPTLRGDALLVEKLESASGIIYWDGVAYRWFQRGD